jgi:hypothetical protein
MAQVKALRFDCGLGLKVEKERAGEVTRFFGKQEVA